jgi:DNA-binding IscR family transcriptional regulator
MTDDTRPRARGNPEAVAALVYAALRDMSGQMADAALLAESLGLPEVEVREALGSLLRAGLVRATAWWAP